MKKNYLLFAAIALISLVAVLTNPNQERHKEVIKVKINTFIQQSIKNKSTKTDNEWAQAGQAFDMLLGSALIGKIVDNIVSTDNYVLFSATKITWEGQTKVIGIGAFGNVFLTNKLDEALEKGLLSK